MKIKQEITETIEAEIDLSTPLFFTSGGCLWRKFAERDGEIVSTWLSTTTGLDIRVSKAYGNDFKVIAGQDKDWQAIAGAVFYKALNEAINNNLPLNEFTLQQPAITPLTPYTTELNPDEIEEETLRILTGKD